ncbi:MAG: sigma-70 family RNA polymerase sigma factor [Silvanigrellales bacterium]|nr:sigma-70 family RNA polymerase sigma factor [Silvanigrellales bacterium]
MSKSTETRWQELFLRAQGGESAAYEALLADVCASLRRWLRRRVANTEAREDVVQDILIGIHQARHTYRPEHSFLTWVNAIARYKVVDYYRRRGRRLSREVQIESDEFETFFRSADEGSPGEESLDDTMEGALSGLPPRQRQAVELLKVKDLSVREAAVAMNVSEGSLKVLAHRGYEALRKALGKGRAP